MAPVFRRAGVDPRPLAGVCALFLLLFCSFGYFYQAGGWNQNSRFALVRAITDRGSFRIDPFQRCTGDRAFENGHYYSDKAPGLAFAAVPVVEAGRFACSLVGVDPESYTGIAALSFVATVATNGLAVALAGLCLFWISRRLGASPGAATLVAVTFGLGTPMWAYATLFIGHALSAACLVFAFAAGVALRENGSVRRHVVLGAVVGAAAGWATITEFPAAIPAVILALFALAQARAHGPGRLGRVAAALGGAALACASIVMIYQQVCFGSPFHIAYRDEVGFAAMHTGLFGIGLPRASRLEMILFGQYRGLLPLAPVLALGPVGLAWLIARRPTRPAAITAASIVVYYFLLNAWYVYWEGGWSFGPRHVSPAIPFLCLGLEPLWTRGRTLARAGVAALVTYGVVVTLVAVSTTAQPPAGFRRPLAELFWPAFRAGHLSMNTQDFTVSGVQLSQLLAYTNRASWNVGQRWLHLSGLASLLPLLAIWIVSATGLALARRIRTGRSAAPGEAGGPATWGGSPSDLRRRPASVATCASGGAQDTPAPWFPA